MLEDAGIEHIVFAKRKVDPRLLEALENVKKQEELMGSEEDDAESEQSEEEEPEEEPEEDTAPVTGLMGNRSKA